MTLYMLLCTPIPISTIILHTQHTYSIRWQLAHLPPINVFPGYIHVNNVLYYLNEDTPVFLLP